MALKISDIEETDFLILDYIYKNKNVSYQQIESNFSKIQGIRATIEKLSDVDWDSHGPIWSNSCISENKKTDNSPLPGYEPLGTYFITEYGTKILQDYKLKLKTDRKNRIVENFWIPVIVTILTTTLIDVIKWWLMHLQK